MKKIIAAIAVAAALIGFATPSQAGLLSIFQPKPKIVATVSISQQKMFLAVTDSRGQTSNYVWTVSTGRTGFETPMGQYQPTWLSKDHKSAQYEDAPMPFAVFFTGGYAVHGTEAVSQLGKRRFPWLRAACPGERAGLLRPGRDLRQVQHPDRGHGLKSQGLRAERVPSTRRFPATPLTGISARIPPPPGPPTGRR